MQASPQAGNQLSPSPDCYADHVASTGSSAPGLSDCSSSLSIDSFDLAGGASMGAGDFRENHAIWKRRRHALRSMKLAGSDAMAVLVVSCRLHRSLLLKASFAATLVVLIFGAVSRMTLAMAHVTGQQALGYAERMANTSTADFWPVTGPAKDRFQYELGVFLRGVELVLEVTSDQKYFRFIKFKVDRFVNENGTIATFAFNEFQLDSILTGRLLLTLFRTTGALKYQIAANLLREQLRKQPRLNEGAFWHKETYPYQIWLDGLYMAEPFYAQYARDFNETSAFDDIALQFLVTEHRTRNETTGLMYHGYDESGVSPWADPVTGHSPSIWGRAMGWYAMGLVDTVEFFPADHPQRPNLVATLNRVAVAVKMFQDPQSGLWWQVMDKGGDAGNYLESSASAMFVYTLAKGVRLGYLPRDQFLESALVGYDGIVAYFVQEAADGGVNYTGTVSVGGLGGKPYRDGTYAYYLSEPVVSNDPKGVGPFMMAGVEISRVPS